MLRRYLATLRDYPLSANAVQGGLLGATGDALAQQIEPREPRIDCWRMLGATAIGASFASMLYPFVYRVFDWAWPGTGVRAVVSKAAGDIVLFGVFGNAASLWLRGSPSHDVQEKMPRVLLNECRVWLPYNLVAFRLVPVHVRPTTTACLALGWNTYMSYTAAEEIQAVSRVAAQEK
jgi:hypothetical protein